MPGPQPISVPLSEKQRTLLEQLSRRQTSPQRLVWRVKTRLAASTGASNEAIARRLRLCRDTVRLWRQRWQDGAEALHAAEAAGDADKVLLARMEALLDAAPRPGSPGDFSAEQLTQLVSVACESPEDSGRPVTHWSPRELAHEVIKRGIVPHISPRTVGRFLKGGGSQATSLDLLAQSSA
jgi:transposase